MFRLYLTRCNTGYCQPRHPGTSARNHHLSLSHHRKTTPLKINLNWLVGWLKFRSETNCTVVWQFAGGINLMYDLVQFSNSNWVTIIVWVILEATQQFKEMWNVGRIDIQQFHSTSYEACFSIIFGWVSVIKLLSAMFRNSRAVKIGKFQNYLNWQLSKQPLKSYRNWQLFRLQQPTLTTFKATSDASYEIWEFISSQTLHSLPSA